MHRVTSVAHRMCQTYLSVVIIMVIMKAGYNMNVTDVLVTVFLALTIRIPWLPFNRLKG